MALVVALALQASLAMAAADRLTKAAPGPGPAGMPAMQRYWFGFLTRGSGYTPERSAHGDSVQAAHLANIGRMFEAGALVCAGPFLDRTPLRGIFIFRGDSARAASFARNDPAIQEKRLVLTLRPWVGPARISDPYREMKKADPARPDSMIRYQLGFLKKGAVLPVADSLAGVQGAHVEHLMSLMRAGTLKVAGPFADAGDPEGVLVFACDSAQATRAMANDPMVRRRWLVLELHPWMTAHGILPAPKWEP